MKHFLVFLAFFFSLTACDDDEKPIRQPYTTLSVFVLDEEGNDLLNSQNENAYSLDEIRVYHIIDGQEKLVANPDGVDLLLYTPENYSGTYPDSLYYVNLAVRNSDLTAGNRCTSIVKWNNTDADTIVCEVNPDYFNEINEVYVNGELMWDTHTVSPIFNVAGTPGIKLIK